ncbi:hypothetical protein CDQ84_13400 [Clostridium thermosuccinogenes]|uniref:Uncharacterized protein n=1 Tax=Clostridium thermosuccinogenes TaxID=84032 RepID=A0A2K2FEV6_9CLOT|nr:hypothetical protein CDO33_12470 [Pseudoclostridium thermosuccinogenes]PNT95922.1 hypothetical protein CDQ85_13270 [Pseudoclostridium thermosuccinogenes]PNT97310.1 hypothetical protein CDQ84_13400 [Pseudoclostridium thermosuccinogenes]
MSKKLSRSLGIFMLVIAFSFAAIALNYPEMSWPMPLEVVYTMYFAYIIAMIFFLMSPFKSKQ